MSLIFSNSHFAGGFGPETTSNDFKRSCGLNPNVSKKFFNWHRYTNLIKLKKWPLIFLSCITFFFTLFGYKYKSSFVSNFKFTEVISTESLCILQVQERICVFLWCSRPLESVEKIPFTTSLKVFSYLLSIHHVISVLCIVLLSPHPYSIGFIPIFQMHLLLLPFHRTCQSIPMYCLSPYHSTQACWDRERSVYSHAAWHNGHLIYA